MTPKAAFVAAIAMLVVLVVYVGSAGVRGTDQYWYLADAETLARSWSVASNNVFPASLLAPGSALPPAFVHNILSLYLAAPVVALLGGIWGWLTLNLLASIATALLIRHIVRRFCDGPVAELCGVFYLLFPLTLWQTAQPLAETSTALFAALLMTAVVHAGEKVSGWLLVTAAAGLLYLSRESYLPVLLLAPIGFACTNLATSPLDRRAVVIRTASLACLVAAFMVCAHLMFTTKNVEFSYARVLHTAVPGFSDNMFLFFDLSRENLTNALPIRMDLLGSKLVENLRSQFVSFDNPIEALFYWTFNILVVLALIKLVISLRDRRRLTIVLAALAITSMHGLTLIIFQNQFRYLMPALPGLVVVAGVTLVDSRWLTAKLVNRHAWVFGGIALAFLPLMGSLAHILHRQAAAEQRWMAGVEELVRDHAGGDERGIVAYDRGYQMIAYAARPRLTLFVEQEYDGSTVDRLVDRFEPAWSMAPANSPLHTVLPHKTCPDEITMFGRRWTFCLFERRTAEIEP